MERILEGHTCCCKGECGRGEESLGTKGEERRAEQSRAEKMSKKGEKRIMWEE